MSLQPAVEPVCCNHAPSDICNRKFGGLSQIIWTHVLLLVCIRQA